MTSRAGATDLPTRVVASGGYMGIIRRVAPVFAGNAFRLGASFLLSKYLAIVHGPAGVALLGQYLNLNSILVSLSTGAIDNGIVRYTAEGKRDGHQRLSSVLSASAQIIGLLACLTLIVVVAFSAQLAQTVFYSSDYRNLVMLMGSLVITQGMLTWSTNVLNGLGQLGALGFLNTVAAIGTVGVIALSVIMRDVEHRHLLVGLALSNLPALAYALWKLREVREQLATMRFRRWPLAAYGQFFRYSLMSGGAAVIAAFTALFVRNLLVKSGGLDDAGVYEGVNRLSTAYLALITTTLAMYYLPKMSVESAEGQRAEMRRMLVLVAPGVGLVGLCVWLLRDPLMTLIYSKEFTVTGRLMCFQMVGDCLKMTSWVLAYQMIARGMVATFLLTEGLAAVLRIGIAAWLIPRFGPEGGVMSYAITSIAYFVAMLWIFRAQFARGGRNSLQ